MNVHFLNLEHLFLVIYSLLKYLRPSYLINLIAHLLYWLRPYAFVLSIILFCFLIYAWIKTREIQRLENKALNIKPTSQPAVEVVNEKWEKVKAHVSSPNPNDWRIAIIEADAMLDEVLEKAGYRGDSVGEKLKGIEPSDMLTLDEAWEAHKARNLIAHEGSDYQLNDREAKRVIELYRKVFEEFYFI